jgi:hypothetical protein
LDLLHLWSISPQWRTKLNTQVVPLMTFAPNPQFGNRPLRARIGGPAGPGKTALVEALYKRLPDTMKSK